MSERVPERLELARLIDPFSQGAPSNDAAEAADRILAAGYSRAHADAEKAEAVRMTLVSAAAWCAQQRMEWVRDAKRNPDSAKAAYGKASSYSAAETHFRALADEVKP